MSNLENIVSKVLDYGIDPQDALDLLHKGNFMGIKASNTEIDQFIVMMGLTPNDQITTTLKHQTPTTTTTTTSTTHNNNHNNKTKAKKDYFENSLGLLSFMEYEPNYDPLRHDVPLNDLPPRDDDVPPFHSIRDVVQYIQNRRFEKDPSTTTTTTTTTPTPMNNRPQNDVYFTQWQEILPYLHPLTENDKECFVCSVELTPTSISLLRLFRSYLTYNDDARFLFDKGLIHGVTILSCGNHFCLECLIAYLKSKLDTEPLLFIGKSTGVNGVAEDIVLPCPAHTIDEVCPFLFTPKILYGFLSQDDCIKYDRRAQGAALTVDIEGMFRCPHRGCEYDFILPSVNLHLPVLCLKCQNKICLECNTTFSQIHKKCPECERVRIEREQEIEGVRVQQENERIRIEKEIEQKRKEEETESNRKQQQDISQKDETIVNQHCKCPKCKIPIFRDNGCDHMHCPKCQYHFCYLCGIEWHYGNHGGCTTNKYAGLENLR